jgi:hypothetical protein
MALTQVPSRRMALTLQFKILIINLEVITLHNNNSNLIKGTHNPLREEAEIRTLIIKVVQGKSSRLCLTIRTLSDSSTLIIMETIAETTINKNTITEAGTCKEGTEVGFAVGTNREETGSIIIDMAEVTIIKGIKAATKITTFKRDSSTLTIIRILTCLL